ncbi:MAG: InlB B-repeat-containing protein [Lachnospiraceae bacterium]
MGRLKKVITVLLCVCMVVLLFPANTGAVPTEEVTFPGGALSASTLKLDFGIVPYGYDAVAPQTISFTSSDSEALYSYTPKSEAFTVTSDTLTIAPQISFPVGTTTMRIAPATGLSEGDYFTSFQLDDVTFRLFFIVAAPLHEFDLSTVQEGYTSSPSATWVYPSGIRYAIPVLPSNSPFVLQTKWNDYISPGDDITVSLKDGVAPGEYSEIVLLYKSPQGGGSDTALASNYPLAGGYITLNATVTAAPTPPVTVTPTPTPAKSSTVTYNANGGTVENKNTVTRTVTSGSNYVLPATPVLANHSFTGWYTARTGGTHITANTISRLTANQTLYAQWQTRYTAIYCIYNKNNGEHFFTASLSERDTLAAAGWKYEGIAWMAPLEGNPVYRLYNRSSGEHFYTMDTYERESLLRLGWKNEGMAWYSDLEQKRPIYRLYNANAPVAAAHHYTVNSAERDSLVKAGWKYEGVAFYGA